MAMWIANHNMVYRWRCPLYINAAECLYVPARCLYKWCCCYALQTRHIIHHYACSLASASCCPSSWITFPILPPGPPPLLPPRTIKRILAQLLIHRIVRLTHPRPELAPTTNPRRVPTHPGLEVFGADPAWVQLAECREEGFGFGLQL